MVFGTIARCEVKKKKKDFYDACIKVKQPVNNKLVRSAHIQADKKSNKYRESETIYSPKQGSVISNISLGAMRCTAC